MPAGHDSPLSDVVFIRKLKRPTGSALWPTYRTGQDHFGTWLFTPQGSRFRGEKDGAVAYCNVGSPVGPGIAVMHLVPCTGWWIATFWDTADQIALLAGHGAAPFADTGARRLRAAKELGLAPIRHLP